MTRRRAGASSALLVASMVCAAGCDNEQAYLYGAGPAAEALADLGWFVLVLFSAITVGMWGLLLWIALRRRGSLAEHAPPDAGGGLRWLLLGGFVFPASVLGVVFVLTLQSMSAFPMAHESGDPEIRVIGRQWWWEAQYRRDGRRIVTVPTEIHIPVGRPVEIALETRDVIHSFWIPKLHGKVDLIPGLINYVRLEASEAGVYRGECAEYCGLQHTHMVLYVVAEPAEQYAAWLNGQLEPASLGTSASALHGRDIFLRGPCAACHTIRGTPARATVGPELTHLASRRAIAGGMLENSRANLQAWVTHAQAMKPGTRMPNLTQFSGEELNALVDYLETLE